MQQGAAIGTMQGDNSSMVPMLMIPMQEGTEAEVGGENGVVGVN